MIRHLETSLISSLKDARSVYIAVALIKEYGLKIIEDNIPDTCIRNYLVGIHLPTPPSILKSLLELQENNLNTVSTRVFEGKENYHPKVYIIENNSGEFIAFIGSANATRGGFSHNIEMNIAITSHDDCIKLKEWFETIFSTSRQYDEAYINAYEITYKRNRILSSTQQSNINELINKTSVISGTHLIVQSGQFFRQSDFDAFTHETHLLDTDAVKRRRGEVRHRFLELNDLIIDQFQKYNITNLHTPYRRNNYTSQHFHSRGNTHIKKSALWLHYGLSADELLKFPEGYDRHFVNHIRIQIILRNTLDEAYLGIWLFVGKENGSYHDRRNLKNELANKIFVSGLYDCILDLGASYWISIGDEDLYISEIENSNQLIEFLAQDNFEEYFIIGRNYQPDDSDISEENISETVLIEFSKLYKIYDLIKATTPI